MLEELLELERETFLWLNGFQTPLADFFFKLYTGVAGWLPILFFVVMGCIYSKNNRDRILIAVSVIVVVMCCDLFTSYLTKPLFARLRPGHHPAFSEVVKTLGGYIGDLYGFMSGHATNAFGFIVFSSLLLRYRPYTWLMICWGLVMAYSRIYLGMHFISDIVGGMIFGSLIGWGVFRLYNRFKMRGMRGDSPCFTSRFATSQKRTIFWVQGGYLVFLFLFSAAGVVLF